MSSARRFAVVSGNQPPESTTRALSDREVAVLSALLARPFEGRDELREQARTARAAPGCDCGCPTIAISVDRTLPRARVRSSVAIEGRWDAQPAPIEVLLFVRDGYLASMELVWYGEAPPRDWPDVSGLTVISYDEPTWSDGT